MAALVNCPVTAFGWRDKRTCHDGKQDIRAGMS